MGLIVEENHVATPRTSTRARTSPSRNTSAAHAAVYDSKPWLSSYPAGIPGEIDIPAIALPELLDMTAAQAGSRAAIIFLGRTLTYRELAAAADRLAAGLASLGVTKGERVAIALPNCPQAVIAFHAVLRVGAIVVMANPQYTEAELQVQLTDSGAKVVICLDKVFAGVNAVRANTQVEHVVVTSLTDFLPTLDRLKLQVPLPKARRQKARLTAKIPKTPVAIPFLSMLRGSVGPAPTVSIHPGDIALLQYTTGTTGTQKAAMLTHGNLVSNAHQATAWYGPIAQPGKEVTLGVLPLFHIYGLTLCLTSTLLLQGTLVLLPRFDQDLVLAAVDAYKPTLFPGVPPLYKALIDNHKTREHDLKSIRACVSGAMKLPKETQEGWEKITQGLLVEGYGMTETSPVTHCNPLNESSRAGTIGLPLPSTMARIVDPDNPSVVLPVGESGELAIFGPQVFAGYWQREEENASALTKDGWLLTGDIAVMTSDGWFEVVDRKKEIIVAGGFNIFPTEIEEVIASMPGVLEVAVVGVPDRYRGETVKAFVVAEPGLELDKKEITEWAAARLTAYKVPKVVEFRAQLPRTSMGKLARRELRDAERAKASDEALAALPKRAASAAKAARTTPPKPALKKATAVKKTVATASSTKAAAGKAGAKATAAKAGPVKKSVAAKTPVKKATAKATAKATTKKTTR